MGMHAKRTLADIIQRITILNESVNESNMLITRSEKIIEDRKRMLERIDNDRKREKSEVIMPTNISMSGISWSGNARLHPTNSH